MKVNLKIWRQAGPDAPGKLVDYTVENVDPSQSFLEMLDSLNEQLVKKGEVPVAFESDCREGICGNCGLVINGIAHGEKGGCTTCEIRMRQYKEGDTITVEPFRAKAFPLIKDLVVNRSAFDRIMSKGGYVAVNAGSAQDANSQLIHRDLAEEAMDAAACIGCGACVAACPNASASLFVGAKISQFTWLPQGQIERSTRAKKMVTQMDSEGFGDCSNHAECEAVCPKEISIANISRMRREFTKSLFARN
ncbi:succinate dehydrogenase/fumarate reductase iron-sulfur subunit [Kiritimatiellota bacterium B12222]|nr:succinate dehydrogenase/fumarate reductase iron-sulfur subunit [Kiritimatiellota bacterium B12222]